MPDMEQANILTEIHLCQPPRSLGYVHLEGVPQPGSPVELEGQQYTILERRHRYRLQANHYQLHHIALYVQPLISSELNPAGGVGDVNCQYNAQSALLRCAINPDGPCQDCMFFVPKPSEPAS
ncbi:DUF6464 family protein [Acaryochloris sp. IP29b_bin.148]|uniref:DUF6464 family protein n=1 Tax=Acaryochloris sp. IP29b_bin.148 TaxID=2969218 RepID=UPI002617DC74|nr:DUF6464 family protein [Acaryochloris sp. IP29b_bin.148]